jgi:hypothetical protein
MNTKTIVILVVVAIVAYIAGAKYPSFAQRFGVAA